MFHVEQFDVIVIGAGHAGIEAAYLSSQFDLRIGLLSMKSVPIGSAPCNPSVGGVGKGQVVREIDAMGGLMGRLADEAGIQFRTLNESKGFAVQSTRVQIDKEFYAQKAEELLSNIENILLLRDKVIDVKRKEGSYLIIGESKSYLARKVIVTVGTFLNGKLHQGEEQSTGGRMGCESSAGLDSIFGRIQKNPKRFKTGTPPRIQKESIDYNALEEQPSDENVLNFHYASSPFGRKRKQVSCYLARTNSECMKVIRDNKELSPMYNGQIHATGARYCPSIEDKAYRYPDKDSHHVFIEPEGLELDTMYPSGISSSLPREVQQDFLNKINGLEDCKVAQYGYAVEYDVVDTTYLRETLEHKDMLGLYFAGQVNGTSGYEEAAGQGLVAGINAALALKGMDALVLERSQSYIGVMINDLCTNLRDEPYRLFTARSENRLWIREDNAIERMNPYRKRLGLSLEIDGFQDNFLGEVNEIMAIVDKVRLFDISYPQSGELSTLNPQTLLKDVLKQPKVGPIGALREILQLNGIHCSENVIRAVAIATKYAGYIKRSDQQYLKVHKLDRSLVSWEKICESKNISFECKQRIRQVRPETFGQLRNIEGIRPATLVVVAAGSL